MNALVYDRSIFLCDMNMQNLAEIFISDDPKYAGVLIAPTYGMFELIKSENANSRSPFSVLMGPYRHSKKGFAGWLADVTVWTKDYSYPLCIHGVDDQTPQQFKHVNLTRVVMRDDLAHLLGLKPDDLNNYLLWVESER